MDTGASIRVVAAPHPLRLDTIEAQFPAGLTIAEIIGRDDLSAIVWADGNIIECERWHEVKPESTLFIRRIPADRNTVRMIAFIALAVALPQVAPTLGLTGAAGFAATAAAGIAGTLAINALIPPVLPSVDGTGGNQRLNSITGQSNQVAPWAPIPKIYGNPTYFPPIPLTGLPYTELVGEDQYIRMLLVLGYGPLDIGGETVGDGHSLVTHNTAMTGNPIKIGGTSIDQFEDVQFQIGAPEDVTLFTSSIVEQAVNVSINKTGADPSSNRVTINDGNSVTRTTDPDTDEVSLDIFCPALFTVSNGGNTKFAQIIFNVHFSPAGADTWTLGGSLVIGSAERKPVRRGLHFNLPAPGEYDIRLTRVSSFYEQRHDFFNDATWTVLRSIKRNQKPFTVPNTVVMALRIRATDQLGGRIDRLSVSATGIIPVWDGSEWVDEATRNPAWIYADIISGVATRTAQPKAKLDVDALDAWAEFCDEEDLFYDLAVDAEGTVFDRAKEVASMGFASWHVTDDARFSVVRDVVSTPRMVITPRNTAGFQSEYIYHRVPHALRVQFIDPDRFEPTERIVYDDGYDSSNATRFEQMQTVGVTTPDHAWKVGRYHLAQLRLRPETYAFNQDIQHLAYQRGDTVELASDVILVGLRAGRVKSVTLSGTNVTTAVVDELLEMEDGKSYALKIQRKDGTIITEPITTVLGGTTTVTFTTPIPEHNYGSGNEPGLQADDHFSFGEAGKEAIRAKVIRIEPQGDFRANVVAVPAADDIFDAWDGAIPPFDPVITAPVNVDLLPPVQPVITDVSSESPPSPVGAPKLRIVVGFDMPPGLVGVIVESRVRVIDEEDSLETRWSQYGSADSGLGVLFIEEVEEGLNYEIQIRSRKAERVSSWTDSVYHLIDSSGWKSQPGATRNIEIVDALPSDDLFAGRLVFLTSDNKVHRYTGTGWTTTQAAADISGTLADAQIAALAASKITGTLTDAQIAEVAAAKIAGTLTDAQLSAIAAAKVTGTLTDAQLAEIAAAKVTGTLTNAQIADIAAAKITGTLSNAQIAEVAATKVTGTLTNAQIADVAAAKITGTITSTQITDSAITTAKIAAGAVETAKLAAGAVTATTIAANAITAAKIEAGAVETAKLAAGAVTADTIATNAITAAKISAGAVEAAKIASGAVETAKLAAGAVTAGAIATNAVTAVKINAGAVETAKIAAGAITADTIATNAVTAVKINAGAVETAKIAAGAVTAGTIATNAVTAAKISAGAVETAKLAAGAVTADTIAANAITAAKIQTGAVEAAKIAAGAVEAGKIAAGAVVAGKIAANAVTATEIASNAITSDKINAGAVTAGKVSVTNLAAINANMGAITAGSLSINDKFLVDSSGNVTIRNASTGQRLVISNSVLEVYDSSGVRRVRLGIWT